MTNVLPWRDKFLLRFILLSFVLMGWVGEGEARDGGVGGGAVSLPTGSGSIEGLGESFQPSMSTGTVSHGFPLSSLVGTHGMSPQLSLVYEGGGGNGVLGLGWGLSTPGIQRRTDKGIPRYVDGPNGIDDDLDGVVDNIEEEDIFIEPSGEDLVPVFEGGVTNYFCKIESQFTRYRRIDDYWEGVAKSGMRMVYGQTEQARIVDPANPSHIFRWLLEKEIDTHGNTIEYHYSTYPGVGNLNERFLVEVRYGPGPGPWDNFFFVHFQYQDRPDWFEECRSGFVIRCGKRLVQVDVGVQGPTLTNHLQGDFNEDGLTDNLVRRYVIRYDPNTFRTLLTSIDVVGADGVSTYPSATFEYTRPNTSTTVSASGLSIGSVNEPSSTFENTFVDLIDLNGDGLPDLLRTETGGGGHLGFINQGQRGDSPGYIQWSAPQQVLAGVDGLAWSSDLASGDAHLADMDGDGLVDLVRVVFDGAYYYRCVPGFQPSQLAWDNQTRMTIQDFPPPTPFSDPDARTSDINFDKRMDIIKSIPVGGGFSYQIWYNLGGQKYSPRITVTPTTGYSLSAAGVEVTDFNGDRVPDIVQIRPSAVRVTAGLGYGNFTDEILVPLPDGEFLRDDQIARASLQDINGDGLADLVLEQAEPSTLWYWENLGNYTFASKRLITGLPAAVGTLKFRWADMNGNGTTDFVVADSGSTPHIQVIDIGQLLGYAPRAYLLTETRNGMGQVTHFEYTSSTDFMLADGTGKDGNYSYNWPYPMPFPVEVLSRQTVSDSLGNVVETRFGYHDPYYDPVEKQFRGFGRSEMMNVGDTNFPSLTTRYLFDVGITELAMKGRMLLTRTEQGDGSEFGESGQTWELHKFKTGLNGVISRWTAATKSISKIVELGSGSAKQIETDYQYDDYGNEIQITNWGIVENENPFAGNDERIVRVSYAYNTNDWRLGFTTENVVMDIHSNVLERTRHFYDDPSFSGTNSGAVTQGDQTLVLAWIDPNQTNAFIRAKRVQYDSFGNPVAEFDPLANMAHPDAGHWREYVYEPYFQRNAVRETQHIGGGHPDLVMTSEYDLGFGITTKITDVNGHSTRTGYDAFGRELWEVAPGDTDAYPTREFRYQESLPTSGGGLINFVETRLLDKTPGSIPGANKDAYYHIGRTYFDGMGRTRLTKGEARPDPATGKPQFTTGGGVVYNARGSASITLQNYYSDTLDFEDILSPGWSGRFHVDGQYKTLGLADAPQLRIEFDALGRVRRSFQVDGSFSETRYEPLVILSYDENATDPTSPFFGRHSRSIHDGLSRTVQMDEINRITDEGFASTNESVWSTYYRFGADNLVMSVTDSQGNWKTMEYDGLHRLKTLNDWDRGSTHFLYDDASNGIEKWDSKGQHIRFTFDGANRPTSQDYLDDNSPEFSYRIHPDVVMDYDLSPSPVDLGDGTTGMPSNTLGNVVHIRDTQGDEYFSYDERGRQSWSVRELPDPIHGGKVPFKTAMEYDSLNRLTRQVYPDGDDISFEYDERTLLRRIAGGPNGSILADRTYLPSGQDETTTFGNGVVTRSAYDARMRLSAVITGTSNGTRDNLVAYRYSFDRMSNIQKIEDARPLTALADGDLRRNTQLFQYDSLNRLAGYQVSHAAPGMPLRNDGQITYRYDRIGNLLEQRSTLQQSDHGWSVTDLGRLTYGGSVGRFNRGPRQISEGGPHALTHLDGPSGSRDIAYDGNGNVSQTGDSTRLKWDFNNHLVEYSDETSVAEYRYDSKGRRISKQVTSKVGTNVSVESVLYVSPAFEVRPDDEVVKYVFDGNRRLAQITGRLNSTNRIQRLRVLPGWNLVSLSVSVSNLMARLAGGTSGAVDAVRVWNATNHTFDVPGDGAPGVRGSVLWVHALQAVTLSVPGVDLGGGPDSIPGGKSFLPVLGPSPLAPVLDLPAGTAFWLFDSLRDEWEIHDLPGLGVDPPSGPVVPGGAVFVTRDFAASLATNLYASKIRYYHDDHLGSQTAVTDESGRLVTETTYYPFGATRTEFHPSGDSVPYGFGGKEKDSESGLHYFEARFLTASLGRFLSVDPFDRSASPQSLNGYAYVENRPTTFGDPTGLAKARPQKAPKMGARKQQQRLNEQGVKEEDWDRGRNQIVEFSREQLRSMEVIVHKGKLIYKQSRTLVDTGGGGGVCGRPGEKSQDVMMFVQTTQGKIYVAQGEMGKYHHSSFLSGKTEDKEVWMAGELMVDHGVIKGVNAQSGHFLPTQPYLDHFAKNLRRAGVKMSGVNVQFGNFTEGLRRPRAPSVSNTATGSHESPVSPSRRGSVSTPTVHEYANMPAVVHEYSNMPHVDVGEIDPAELYQNEEPALYNNHEPEEEPNYNNNP